MPKELPTFGRFVAKSVLGSGHFASAYLVEDETGATFALKHSRVATGDVAERLRNEAAMLQLLDHESIPAFIEMGEDENGFPFFVMDLAPGRTLESRLNSHASRNARFSDFETLLVVRELLQTLAYLADASQVHDHGYGFVHRDIKSANIMVSDSLEVVTLIDFGFAKENDAVDKRLDDSFFRAGAARYSPPEKHRHPTRAKCSHDVFAVGVVAYQMLTGQFPWSVPVTGDVGELEEAMRRPAPRIRQLNNTCRPSVADFVLKLIEVDDAYRPSAADALGSCTDLLDELADSPPAFASIATIELPEVWRDPLHGDIRLTRQEIEIIDTAEMQRLRGYAQLGLTYMAFEGARHSRLLHSVGSVERVEQILTSIEKIDGISVAVEERLAARLYALTHDVTHIAFGHTIEDEYGLYVRHDRNQERIQRLVLDASESELARVLESSEIGREVRSMFDLDASVHARSDIGELVSGPVGADVLDYVDRDSMFLGLDHRIDSAIFRQLRLAEERGSIDGERHLVSVSHGSYGVRSDREYALESLYEQRYALYLKAFTHKTKIKASALLMKALGICTVERDKPAFSEREIERAPSDRDVLNMISGSKGVRASRLVDDLNRRNLPSATYRAPLMPEAHRMAEDFGGFYEDAVKQVAARYPDLLARIETERRIAKAAKVDPDQVFLYLPPTAPGFKKTQSHRFLVDAAGQALPPPQPWFRQLRRKHLGLWHIWVFAGDGIDQNGRRRLGAAAESEFDRKNQIFENVSQKRLF